MCSYEGRCEDKLTNFLSVICNLAQVLVICRNQNKLNINNNFYTCIYIFLHMNSIQMESANNGYQLCPTCNKPLINEENLKLLRIKWIKWGVLGLLMTLAGGAIGACVLPFLGFGSAGVTAGSFAASWQGPAVVAGSVFAICQSLGATGLGILFFGATGSVIGGVGALGLIYKHRDILNWCCCDDHFKSTS